MRTFCSVTTVALLLFSTFAGLGNFYRSGSIDGGVRPLKRISFEINALEELNGRSEMVSQSTVEGPQGTDFSIHLKDTKFEMDAGFLTDLSGSDILNVRAILKTRRLYGYSERKLPLFEEDQQLHSFKVTLDEKLVLFPFGGDNQQQQFRIEITPRVSASAYTTSGSLRPIEISISKQSPGGAINIEASRVPHRFLVDARLTEDGREIAKASAVALYQLGRELFLSPDIGTSTTAGLRLTMKVDKFQRSRASEEVGFSFDLVSPEAAGSGQRKEIVTNGAGIASVSDEIKYDVSSRYQPVAGKRYELRLRIKPAPGEEIE